MSKIDEEAIRKAYGSFAKDNAFGLWEHFEARASKEKDRAWDAGKWLLGLFLVVVAIPFSTGMLSISPYECKHPFPAAILMAVAVVLSMLGLKVLKESDEHIRRNFDRALAVRISVGGSKEPPDDDDDEERRWIQKILDWPAERALGLWEWLKSVFQKIVGWVKRRLLQLWVWTETVVLRRKKKGKKGESGKEEEKDSTEEDKPRRASAIEVMRMVLTAAMLGYVLAAALLIGEADFGLLGCSP